MKLSYKEYIIATSLRRFSKESFYRWGDKNALPNSICYANYFGGTSHIDSQAESMSEVSGLIIEPEDIVQFVYTYLRTPANPHIDYGEQMSEAITDSTHTTTPNDTTDLSGLNFHCPF